MAFEGVLVTSTRNGVSAISGYRQDLAIADAVVVSLTSSVGVSTYKWELLGRPEGSVAGGAGPEPIELGTSATAAFTVDSDAGFRKDGTYVVQCTVNAGTPTETRIRALLVRLSGTALGDGRTLRKIGAGETIDDDTSVAGVDQGYATQMNRWLEFIRAAVVSGGAISTATYLTRTDQTGSLPNSFHLSGHGSGFVKTDNAGTVTIDTSAYLSQAYATVQQAGASVTQRSLLNFVSAARITAVDNAGATRTDVDLATTAVTPGSYTTANITVDAYGRLTAASSGTAPTTTATYVTKADETGTLPNSIHLSGHGSGFVKVDNAGAITIDTSTYLTTAAAGATYQPILTAATGANLTGTFIVQTASAGEPNAQALGALATGILKSTTATGVVSIAAANTDYADPGAFYVVTKAAGAPSNADNLGLLSTGFLRVNVAGGVATISSDASTYLTTAAAAATYQPILTSGSGANLTSKFIVQGTVDAGLTSAQFLGALGTGLVKNTTAAGVLSIGAANTDYADPTAFYLVNQATNAPTNAVNLGALGGGTGMLRVGIAGGVATVSSQAIPASQVTFGTGTFLTSVSSFRVASDGGGHNTVYIGPNIGGLTPGLSRLTITGDAAGSPAWLVLDGSTAGVSPLVIFGNDKVINSANVFGGINFSKSTDPHPNALTFSIGTFTPNVGTGDFLFTTATNGDLVYVSGDGRMQWLDQAAAVSASGGAAIRANSNKLQYSENGGAWANFTDLGGASASAYYVVLRSTSEPANATNLGGLTTGLVKSTVSGGNSTLSIDATAYLSGSIGPGAGTYGGGSAFVNSVTLDVNGRVTAVATGTPPASGANALGFYLVNQTSNAPTNAVNLGALSTGFVKATVAGGVATISTDNTLISQAYTTIEAAGSGLAQRSVLNFSADFSAADNAGATRTDIGLATTGVSASTYTFATITVDSRGRITNASSGSVAATSLHYVVTQAEGSLPNSTNLGGFATGLVKATVSGGVATLSTDSSAYLTQAYSTVADNGSSVAQRSLLNFSSLFTVTDNPGATRTDVTLATSYQPILSLTSTDVLFATGSTTVGQDSNFTYNSTTHKLTLGGFAEIDGTSGAGSIGQALIFGRAGDQAITKTGGTFSIATLDSQDIVISVNNSTAAITLDPATGGRILGDWSPATDIAYNLGSSTKQWTKLYAGTISGGTASHVLTLQSSDSAGFTITLGPAEIDVKGSMVPAATATYDLGATGHLWNAVWATTVQGNAGSSLSLQDISGITPNTSIFLSNTAITIKGTLLPAPTETYDLGSPIHVWSHAYVDTLLSKDGQGLLISMSDNPNNGALLRLNTFNGAGNNADIRLDPANQAISLLIGDSGNTGAVVFFGSANAPKDGGSGIISIFAAATVPTILPSLGQVILYVDPISGSLMAKTSLGTRVVAL